MKTLLNNRLVGWMYYYWLGFHHKLMARLRPDLYHSSGARWTGCPWPFDPTRSKDTRKYPEWDWLARLHPLPDRPRGAAEPKSL